MVSKTDTAIGWTVVGLAAAGAAYYYSQSGKGKKGRSRIHAAPTEQSQRRESDIKIDLKDKRKKIGVKGKGKASDQSDQATTDVTEASEASVQTSPSDRAKKRKGGKQQQQPSKLAQSSTVKVDKTREVEPNEEKEEDEGMSNADFAKQLSGLKTGTSLKKPTTTNETVRTRKQGKRNEELPQAANGAVGAQDLSTASSTTGADADDDLSLPMSPEFGATESTTPSGADVSDMLEAPKKSPSVLRLTEPSNPQPSRQSRPQEVAPMPETKKQRQNRQKNEKKKAMRDEEEILRRALLEKQKADVRVAEGRPPKNGQDSLKGPKPPVVSPWALAFGIKDFPPYPPEIDTPPDSSQLLDTFDEAEAKTSPDQSGINGGANNVSKGANSWQRDLPSEEEQMKRISELDSDNAWSTVGKGGKGKKKSAAEPKNKKAEASGITSPGTKNIFEYVMSSNDADLSSNTNDAMSSTFVDAQDNENSSKTTATKSRSGKGY